MTQKARFVVVMLAAAIILVAACGDDDPGVAPVVAADDGGPQFCDPVKQAFQALFEVESSEYEAYTRAAQVAAENLREAAKSASPELAEAIGGVAIYYEKTAADGQPLGLSAFQEVRPHVGKLAEAVEDQCGFTIDSGEKAGSQPAQSESPESE